MKNWWSLAALLLVFTRIVTECCAFLVDVKLVRKRVCFQHRPAPEAPLTDEHGFEWTVPRDGLSGTLWEQRDRPHLDSEKNATLPVALVVLAPEVFPTRSKAMRSIRQKQIFMARNGTQILGKADTRVYPLDSIQKLCPRQTSASGYPGLSYAKPSFTLPVIFEDDHMAIVNKPSGMICHSYSKGGYSSNSVLRMAPHVLTPPKKGTYEALERPSLVHRLDAPACGCLVLAKTRPAGIHLSHQFASRTIQKSYVAILQEPLLEDRGSIDSPIDNKPAVTDWRVIRRLRSAKTPALALVEFKPRTGRKHQLRRHASQVLRCPIVGDDLYGSSIASQLLLCAKEIQLQHPFHEDEEVVAKIELPAAFTTFMEREDKRYVRYEKWMMETGIQALVDICNAIESKKNPP